MLKKTFSIIFIFLNLTCFAQKVGLVFSGGGAKGLAHIGVLKALEENNIPIDCITGTSMGAVVGAMYAAGYSPQEMEYIALSQDFQNWVSGKYKSDYSFYFNKKPVNPSFISAKIKIDTGFNFKLRSNLVNDIPLNFALVELLSQASAHAKNDFNNLFVPFSCVVSDVFSQKMIVKTTGNLAEAVRGSMSVPLVYRPIKIDDEFVFDGGIYNNFPIDVMKNEYKPDIVIGSNVSSKDFIEYPKDNDEKLMSRLFIYLFLSKSDSSAIGKNGIYIAPKVKNYGVTNFAPVKELIEEGYQATLKEIPQIKAKIAKRVSTQQLEEKRKAFNNENPYLIFNKISVSGVNAKQRTYIKNILSYDKRQLSLNEVKKGYYKLLGDDNFETIYPKLNYLPQKNLYDFDLIVQPEKNLKIDFGGNISSRPVSNVYLGIQYNILNKLSYTFNANFYSGRFYESAQGLIRVDIPSKTPVFLESEFTYNSWDYANSSKIFSNNYQPVFIEQSDRRALLKLGLYSGKNAYTQLFGGYFYNNDAYSPTENFSTGDILDKTIFSGFLSGLKYEKNTLNRKQYANSGSTFSLGLSYFNGVEEYNPGNIFRNNPSFITINPSKINRQWAKISFNTEKYFRILPKYNIAYQFDAIISNRPIFSTYKSNMLSSAAFYPFQDSKSLFLENFRADKFMSAGFKNVVSLSKNIDWRTEGFIFQPFKVANLQGMQQTKLGEIFAKRRFSGTSALVYHTPVGPLSLNFNYYDDPAKRFGIFFHIGFILYNKRSLEL